VGCGRQSLIAPFPVEIACTKTERFHPCPPRSSECGKEDLAQHSNPFASPGVPTKRLMSHLLNASATADRREEGADSFNRR
jgi:hypothetical protein